MKKEVNDRKKQVISFGIQLKWFSIGLTYNLTIFQCLRKDENFPLTGHCEISMNCIINGASFVYRIVINRDE